MASYGPLLVVSSHLATQFCCWQVDLGLRMVVSAAVHSHQWLVHKVLVVVEHVPGAM